MKADDLKMELRNHAIRYAEEHGFAIDRSPKSAIIFKDIAHSFYDKSYRQIVTCPDWHNRLQKKHTQVKVVGDGIMEMQSSNSSDALLMNIFCHPKIDSWKGVKDLLCVSEIKPLFGFKAKVEKEGTDGDASEIDMAIDDLFVEAKLTENDFVQKPETEVAKYTQLARHFAVSCFRKVKGNIDNYQVIRNLLASIQHGNRHILLCDERRSDLVRSYMQTVGCLLDATARSRCNVVFWQELQRVCGSDLAEFIQQKYGIC